ncbi:MAG: pirin family protein [Myxococcales bacterium]|nr:pirin family protein [Myxococcales bacterium]MCB9552005.1 pirin family protein [Myxococcales bacterium]
MADESAIEVVITPRERDLGGFTVRRVLPWVKRRMVGPFIFLDQMGPVELAAGTGMDVRPHPHIGLATVTYLFEGAFEHRDSLGSFQVIRPGAVNWMTAGRGIVHSERTGAAERVIGGRVFGMQSWVALPVEAEEVAPSFVHHPAETLPAFGVEGAALRLIAGTAYGQKSPVEVFSPLFYVDAVVPRGARLPLPAEHEERAVYVAVGAGAVAGEPVEAGTMVVVRPGADAGFTAAVDSRVMLLGGAPVGPRLVWWNFVSSRADRIEQAKADWAAGRFGKVPGDEIEFIPLPAE